MYTVDQMDIAEHARLKWDQEDKEQEEETSESHLLIIKVAIDEDMRRQIGKDIYFDLVDHEKVKSFRIQRQTLFSVFKEEITKEFGVPVQLQRYWFWAKRQNCTYRPHRLLTRLEEAQTVGELREASGRIYTTELKLFLEVELGPELLPISPPEKAKDDILLFFKLYDPEKEDMRYVGRLFVKGISKPTEILSKLNEMAGYAPDQEIELYEEITFEPSVICEIIDKNSTFQSSELGDGDIVCFQKSQTDESRQQFLYPGVPLFLEYVGNRQVVHFRTLGKPKEEGFCLEMSMINTYDEVVEKIAEQLKLDDPSKIRLTSHSCYSQQPKPHPIKHQGVDNLVDMLMHHNQTSDILYYEVLDVPSTELQDKVCKTAKTTYAAEPLEAENLTKWGGALLELSQFQPVNESKKMISDPIAKLEEALEVNPQKHEAFWCLGNAYISHGFLNPDKDEAKVYFDKAAQCFQQAVDADPENELYQRSFEISSKVSELHDQIHKQGPIQQAMGPGPSTAASTKGTKNKSSDLKYDILGWVILAVGLATWGFAKSY